LEFSRESEENCEEEGNEGEIECKAAIGLPVSEK
jgi:hypothetical protein